MSKKEVSAKQHSPVRDLIGFVLLAAAVFVMIVLASYHASDPSLHTNVIGDAVFVENYGGIIGSYLADLLMQFFGFASFLFVFALVGVAFSIVFAHSKTHRIIRSISFILLLLSMALLFSLVEGDYKHVPSWGGAFGYWLKNLSIKYLGAFGSYLTVVMMIIATSVLNFKLTFQGFLEKTSLVYPLVKFAKQAFAEMFSKTSDAVAEAMDRGEEMFEDGMEEIKKSTEKEKKKTKIATPAAAKYMEDEQSQPSKLSIVLPKMNDDKLKGHLKLVVSNNKKSEEGGEQRTYQLPPIDLLEAPENQEIRVDKDELLKNARILEAKMKDFGVFGKVVEVQPGPVVTMYEFEPAPGVKVNQITRLNDDLALALKALSVRITLLPGKAVVGIEVANTERQTVYLKEIVASQVFADQSSFLGLALGKEISGESYAADLRKMPHLLIAGATGSGKSVAVNSMILSILYRSTPEDVRMILVDPKMLELSLYDGIPHLLLPVVTDPRKAAAALRWAVSEMERRYRLMADIGVRNIEGYNKKVPQIMEDKKLKSEATADIPLAGVFVDPNKVKPDDHKGSIPYIMIVIDELADLMMVSSHEVEESIIRLAQMARAAGIHLLLATQRPSVDVITGVIKANMPARISFQVSSKIDSRTILDANGSELLLGNGDMLFLPPGTSKLLRVHGAYVSDHEVKKVTDFWKAQGKPNYDEEIIKIKEEEDAMIAGDDPDGEIYQQALQVVRANRVASISMIQRRLRIGYNRAARLVERMDEEGLLAPGEVGKPREVILSRLDGGF